MKEFVAREERARLEPVQDRRKRERSVKPRRNDREKRKSIPPLMRDIRIQNRVTREILMISEGIMNSDNANARNKSL